MPSYKRNAVVKSWTTLEDQIVILSSTGHFSELTLAQNFNVSVPYVKKVLSDPRAQVVLATVRDKIRENLVHSVEGELTYLASKAVQVLKVTLEAELPATHDAKPNQDKVALAVLKGMGYLGEEANKGGGGLQLSPEQHSSLLAAIEKSDRVAKMGLGEENGAVQEAEVEEDG